MRSAVAIAMFVAAAAPVAAGAQSALNLSLVPAVPLENSTAQAQTPSLAMPSIDYVARDGRISFRRGIVAGVEVSPGASFGLGIFDGAPKRRMGAPDPAKPERRSKRAAVGFSLKF